MRMKRIIPLLLVVLMLGSAMAAGFVMGSSGTGAVAEAKPSVKLKTKKGKIYCYKNGKKVKNQWMTIKGRKYYFGKKGAAAIGSAKIKKVYYVFDAKGRLFVTSQVKIVTVNNIKYRIKSGGKAAPGWDAKKEYYYGPNGALVKNGWSADNVYYFDANGKKVTGIKAVTVKAKDSYGFEFDQLQLFAFDDSGKKDTALSAKLQKACVREKDFTDLKALIGEPKKADYKRGCYDGPEVNGEYPYKDGKDGILTYDGFKITTYKAPDGTEFFMSVTK